MQIQVFLYFLQKHGLSYAFYGISFPSPKMRTIICNFRNFFTFSQKRGISNPISELSNKDVKYHIHFLEFLSLLQKRGLSYAISKISFSSPKTWTIICNF